MPHPQSVEIDPPLEPGEVAFLAAFASEHGGSRLRRVWPGQPSRRCPWRPSPDGESLELDEEMAQASPDGVATWLRFLSREFLAPSTAASLDAALTQGLRGGHRMTGAVVVGRRRVTIAGGRVVEEEPPAAEVDAVVLDLDTRRAQLAGPGHTER